MPVPPTAAAHLMGRSGLSAIVGGERIAAAPSMPFLLKHHPSSWEVVTEGVDGPTWVPVLKKHVIRPGVAGVSTPKKGRPIEESYKASLATAGDLGWVIIQADQPITDAKRLPTGVPAGSYIRAIDCRHPQTGGEGVYYAEAWEVPLAGETLPGEFTEFKFDRASYNRWRVSLVEDGVVKPPRERDLVKVKDRLDARIPRARSTVYNDPVIKKEALAKVTAPAEAAKAAKVPKVGREPAQATT